MLHTRQWNGIKPGTVLAADETATGEWLDLGNIQGTVSVTLYDSSGVSTSQDITYQVGIDPTNNLTTRSYAELDAKLIAVTPADGGAIGTNVDCNGATNNIIHDTLTLPDARYIRFLVHNDVAMGDATDYLIIEGQV